MIAARQTKIVFWAVICTSCVWLIVALAIGAAGIRLFSIGGFNGSERGPVEILIVSALALQPVLILFLIFRAIRLRGNGRPRNIVARAFYPLAPSVLLAGYFSALVYLDHQTEVHRFQRLSTGSITYVCSTVSRTADYHPNTIGPTELRLTESRHPGRSGHWTVAWPGKKPIEAISFEARTGNIGGSQGIKWQEPDGRRMIAYLSFSDIITDYGPGSVWVRLVQDDVSATVSSPDNAPPRGFTCGPGSYHQ